MLAGGCLLLLYLNTVYFWEYRAPGISGNLVVKSKLPPWSDSSLEAVKPHPWKGAIKFFSSIQCWKAVDKNFSTNIRTGVFLWELKAGKMWFLFCFDFIKNKTTLHFIKIFFKRTVKYFLQSLLKIHLVSTGKPKSINCLVRVSFAELKMKILVVLI